MKLFFLVVVSFAVHASEMSELAKTQIYLKANFQRPNKDKVVSITDPAWHDLDGHALADRINRLGDDKKATYLAASCIEFNFLLEPLHNRQLLEERRAILTELEKECAVLNPLLREMASLEHVFIHLLQEEQNVVKSPPLLKLCFEGGLITVATALSLPYMAKHFLYDARSIMAKQNILFLSVMVCLKAVGSISGLHTSCQYLKSYVHEISTKIRREDRFVMDFSKAMTLIKKIMAIVLNNPTLANTFTIFADFDAQYTASPDLQNVLFCAEKRRLADDNFFSRLWAKKNSTALYDRIKNYTNPLKYLFYALARLDAYVAIIRIHHDRRERGLPTTFAVFKDDACTPFFSFTKLENPLIENPIANDLTSTSSIIVNGPSMCGKSTAMKSVVCGYFMALSIFLVHAEKAEVALVRHIGVYSNISDDITHGLSSFAAQNKAIKQLEKLAQEPEGIILLLIDEPYAGCFAPLGEAMTVRFIKKLLKNPRVMFLLATHFKEPTMLAEESHDAVRNWHPEVVKNGDTMTKTFKILPGIAEWWYQNQEQALLFLNQFDHQETSDDE